MRTQASRATPSAIATRNHRNGRRRDRRATAATAPMRTLVGFVRFVIIAGILSRTAVGDKDDARLASTRA